MRFGDVAAVYFVSWFAGLCSAVVFLSLWLLIAVYSSLGLGFGWVLRGKWL